MVEGLARVAVTPGELGGERHEPLDQLVAGGAVAEPVQA